MLVKLRKKSVSMLKRLLFPMTAVLIFQAILFYGAIIWGGTIDKLTTNSFEILNERVINRKISLENQMVQHWSNITMFNDTVNTHVENSLTKYGKTYSDLNPGSEAAEEALSNVLDDMIYQIRMNYVNGVFVIFNGSNTAETGETDQYTGLHIRNLDQDHISSNNTDLLVEHAPSKLTKTLNIPLDTWWKPVFEFTPNSDSDFYFKPYNAAFGQKIDDFKDYGFWALPHRVSGEDIPVVSYSTPLVNQEGEVYGVIGVEITVDYIQKCIPYTEINSDRTGAFLLGMSDNEENAFVRAVSTGSTYKQLFGESDKVYINSKPVHTDTYSFKNCNRTNDSAYGSVQYLDLYNSNTPFEHERWALIGIQRQAELNYIPDTIKALVLFSLMLSIVIGFVCVLISTTLVTHPITSLVNKLRESTSQNLISLDKIGMTEIDELSTAIEMLSRNVADNASKLSRIISMADVDLGAFEFDKHTTKTFCSGSMFSLLGLEPCELGYVSTEVFNERMDKLNRNLDETFEEKGVRIYRITSENQPSRWVRLKMAEDDFRILGVIVDITHEMHERRKVEYERDYDILTNLLNRRAFQAAIEKRFENESQLKISAILMMDLDNLKYINDMYGHDYGDLYIKTAASGLQKTEDINAIISRRSGDEFFVFLSGYETKEDLRKVIDKIKDNIRTSYMNLPNGQEYRLKASAGVAWYPEDSTNYEDLIRYADFAMYRVKNTTKGEFTEFDAETYRENSHLLQSKGELNKLIDSQLIEYHFQPIVDVKTGNIFAYEALMRSKLETLKSPLEILAIAKSQSMLYQIERLTWFLAMETYVTNIEKFGNSNIFINSISNQTLSQSDIFSFEKKFETYLPRIVLELTEEEKSDETFTGFKKNIIARWGASIAIDDFGSGYNGESALLAIEPEFVKLDMSLIRGVEKDESRYQLLSNLISYAKGKNIKIISEGVETLPEMETLIALGTDYIQGYFLGKPSKEPQLIDPKLIQLLCETTDRLQGYTPKNDTGTTI